MEVVTPNLFGDWVFFLKKNGSAINRTIIHEQNITTINTIFMNKHYSLLILIQILFQ